VDRDLEEFMRDEGLKTPKSFRKDDLMTWTITRWKMILIEEDIPATDDAAEDDDDY
jgi:hypothetical protein